jgi:hypothetical protein
MALRRSSDALRVLPLAFEAPVEAVRTGRDAGAAVDDAATLAPEDALAWPPIEALPPVDIALRLANALALVLFASSCAAIVLPRINQ